MPNLPVTHFSSFSTWRCVLLSVSSPIKPSYKGRVMGFVGGGGNIAIATALHPSFCVLYCKHLIVCGILYLIFYACLSLWFLDVETNPDPRHPVATVCKLLCSNVRGLARNLSDLTVTSSLHDIRLCSETLDSDMLHVLSYWLPDLVTLSCCAGAECLLPDGWRHTYEMDI